MINVDVNRTEDGLVRDVDFEAVRKVAGAITPGARGVAPMSIACLLRNTLRAARAEEPEHVRDQIRRAARLAPYVSAILI